MYVGVGRGASGKSVLLKEVIDAAIHKKLPVAVVDADTRSKTLRTQYPKVDKAPYTLITPRTEEPEDVRQTVTDGLNFVLTTKGIAAFDFGGGDRNLLDYMRNLDIVRLCAECGIDLMVMSVLGPREEDLEHALEMHRLAKFPPQNQVLIFNEGVVPDGMTVRTAFDQHLESPAIKELVGSKKIPAYFTRRLPHMEALKLRRANVYAPGSALSMVEAWNCLDWTRGLQQRREKVGLAERFP